MKSLTKRKVVFYLLAIFIAGAAAGVVLGYSSARKRVFHPPPPQEIAEHFRARLQSRLGLTPEQKAQIDPLIVQACAEMESVQRDCWDRLSETVRRMNEKIAAHLTPEQRL